MAIVQKSIKSIYNLQTILDNLDDNITNIEFPLIKSDTVPLSATEGEFWYNTLTKQLSFYREVFDTPGTFEWAPFVFNNDVIDGGTW